jgi:hypothetical protein
MGTGIYRNIINGNSISDNLPDVTKDYPLTNGLFGKQGNSSRDNTRHIDSDDPISTSKDFYDRISQGSTESTLSNGKGVSAKLSDGTIITYRKVSSSDGSPVVDINIRKSSNSGGVKQQKIHFTKKGDNKK